MLELNEVLESAVHIKMAVEKTKLRLKLLGNNPEEYNRALGRKEVLQEIGLWRDGDE